MDQISHNYDSNDDNDQSDSDNDNTLSQLSLTDVNLPNSSKQSHYQDVIQYVQIEEQKVMNDLHRNQQLLPEGVKKGYCNLKADQVSLNYFNKEQPSQSDFIFYLGQRRISQQSIKSSIIHVCQFITYVKVNNVELQLKNDVKQILSTICSSYPTLPHNHFDYLYENHLQPSTIIARIDSIAVLYEWLRINSNNMTSSYYDVSYNINLSITHSLF